MPLKLTPRLSLQKGLTNRNSFLRAITIICVYCLFIIFFRYIPEVLKTIKPSKVGGIAGGEKVINFSSFCFLAFLLSITCWLTCNSTFGKAFSSRLEALILNYFFV